jgi:hypothetical protein
MRRRRLLDILMKSAVLAVGAVGCDETHEDTRTVSRSEFTEQIDRCEADATDCDALCEAVFEKELFESSDTSSLEECKIVESDDVHVKVFAHYTLSFECGRRPRGFVEPARTAGAGAWLARIATLEAASVTAFARLARTLALAGAPRRLVAAARRAVTDEIRHARLVGALARRHGVTPAAPVIHRVPPPSLVELARDNAIEGQVGETFGALLATCQARGATDPLVRATFARIARDEADHAVLAHRLAAWLAPKLSRSERAEVHAMRTHAIAALDTDAGVAAADRAWLGVPAPAPLARAARAMFAAI